MFPERQAKSQKKPRRKLIMKLTGCWCFDSIFGDYGGKCSDSYPIKIVDSRSYASKDRPLGSRHHILGRISARYVLTEAYFDIEADASIAEILSTDFKPS